jgi:hypothetical protein
LSIPEALVRHQHRIADRAGRHPGAAGSAPHPEHTAMAEFLILLRTPAAPRTFSPEELQTIVERYAVWTKGLVAGGKLVGGQKLREGEGRVLKKQGSETSVIDGPYAELKEVVGGAFQIRADHYDEAVEIVRSCPHLDYGGAIEVREIERDAMR